MKKEDVLNFKSTGEWRVLEKHALLIFEDLQKQQPQIFSSESGHFALGGGTRLMLDLDHRVSDDIDIFLDNPQLLGYFSPSQNDTVADICDDYDICAEFIKLKRVEGEIDIIVGPQLLGMPLEKSRYTEFLLEPIAEVLAKKLFYRGDRLAYRDLFDWWAIKTYSDTLHSNDVKIKLAEILSEKFEGIQDALNILNERKHTHAKRWDDIKTWYKPEISEAIKVACDYIDELKAINASIPKRNGNFL